MEYKKKRSALMIENLTLVMLVVFTILVQNWLFKGIVAFFLILLVKDQFVHRNYCIRTSQEGICEVKGTQEKCLKFSQIEYITVNRKFKKYIAIGQGGTLFNIRNNLENRTRLVNYIIEMTKTNRDIYVDDRVPVVLRRYP